MIITEDTIREFSAEPGQAYVFSASGDFGGGTIELQWYDGAGWNTFAECALSEEGVKLVTIPLTRHIRFSVTGTTLPNIIANVSLAPMATNTETKELLGLGSVDNTSDVDKPVSTAQQAALNATRSYMDSLVPGLSDAEADAQSYLARISVATTGDAGSTATTPTYPDAVRQAIASIYSAVGKSNLIEAWFLSSYHNIITAGSNGVPAFLSSANNGTLTGSTLPTVGTDGTLFTKSYPNCIKLPAFAAELTASDGFTDIVICQPSGNNIVRGAMGNQGTDGTGTSGYNFEIRFSTTPNQQTLGLLWAGDAGVGSTSLICMPELNNWQTGIASYVSGTQRIFRNGRLLLSSASTQVIGTMNRNMVIGAQGMRTDAETISGGFNGKIIFAAKLKGILSQAQAWHISNGLRIALSPECGGINLVMDGDSRIGGMALSGGQFTYDAANDDQNAIGYQLSTRSNWAGKVSVFRCGTSGDTLWDILHSGQYDTQIRFFRPIGLQRCYYLLHAGVNDAQYGTGANTASDFYASTKAILTKAKSDGFSTIVINQPMAQDGYQHGLMAPLNALIEVGKSSGDLPADYVIDVSDMSAMATPTWFDGLHYTDTGKGIVADRINAAITSP